MITATLTRVLHHIGAPVDFPAMLSRRRRRSERRASRRSIRHVHGSILVEIFNRTRQYRRYGTQPITLVVLFPIGEHYRETHSHETPDFWIVYGETSSGARQTIIECSSEILANHFAEILARLWPAPEPEIDHSST